MLLPPGNAQRPRPNKLHPRVGALARSIHMSKPRPTHDPLRTAARRALFLIFCPAQRGLKTEVARTRPLERATDLAQEVTGVGNEALHGAAYGPD
jgi:hypothetical protein